MSRPLVEMADIVRCAGQAFIERSRKWINWQHRKVLLAIVRCRTAALGGHRALGDAEAAEWRGAEEGRQLAEAAGVEARFVHIASDFITACIPDLTGTLIGGKAGHGKPGSLPRPAASSPAMDIPAPNGAVNLKKGQRVRHVKYGEGTILLREGEGEGAKLTILFNSHGVKKLMEKFANLKKI